jgi:hypothetical protein
LNTDLPPNENRVGLGNEEPTVQTIKIITGIKTYNEASGIFARESCAGRAVAASFTSPDGGKTITLKMWMQNWSNE